MSSDPQNPVPPDEDTESALRDARARFVAGFAQRLRAMGRLLSALDGSPSAPTAPLAGAAHKMAGLAGMLGFPSVSEHAAALETILTDGPPDAAAARAALDRMGEGFMQDMSGTVPSWAVGGGTPSNARILLVEDDADQRQVAAAGLRANGYKVVTAETGPDAIQIANAEHPDLILLDVDLPGLDGMAVCRQIKLNPSLAGAPVVFCTARADEIDRVSGLALGADAYMTKPYAPAELLVRIRRLLARRQAAQPPAAVRADARTDDLLPYDLFATAAEEVLAGGPASLALVLVPAHDWGRVSGQFAKDLRRRDLLGRHDATHLVALLPGLPAAEARAMVREIVDAMEPPPAVAVGVEAGDAGTAIADLISRADLALAADRVARSGRTDGQTTILIAEDDPDVLHIVDSRLRAEGYRTVLTLDGQQTLDGIDKETPAVVVLDLMMPKLTGFDVLARLNERPDAARPFAIVVSARGRDADVTRAFDLGADDYLTKPFNPSELVARIARLIR